MTLQRTDVGTGQTTRGASRRSPEVFIPLAARDEEQSFWRWPDGFAEDPEKPGKWDRRDVLMRVSGEITRVTMMTWPDKHDFRLRSERLRSAGHIGDLLKIEVAPDGGAFEYDATIVAATDPLYAHLLSLCVSRSSRPNSLKQWGYY
jgi:hypothetical protein